MQTQTIGSQLKDFFKSGSLLSVIIIINLAVWVITLLFPLVDYLFDNVKGTAEAGWMDMLALSSRWDELLTHPWAIVTYMFLHAGFGHLFFNMLMLYFGGIMCCRYLGSKKFGWIYFLCGVFGALLYLLVYNLFPVGRTQVSMLVGASAAVLGVFIAVAVYIPNQEVSFWLVRTFTFKMKYVAIAFVVIDLLSISRSNPGGHIAHLGGALAGWLYVLFMRRQEQWERSHRSGSRRPQGGRPLSDDEYNRRRAENQRRIDAILDKISKSGYESLSREEKEFLFKNS